MKTLKKISKIHYDFDIVSTNSWYEILKLSTTVENCLSPIHFHVVLIPGKKQSFARTPISGSYFMTFKVT